MILYVNGIDTTLREGIMQKRAIAFRLNRAVALFHNPTEGFFADLRESAWNKWMSWWKPSAIVTEAIKIIVEKEPRYLIGHSQGCMIILNALCHIPEGLRRGIKCSFFASPKVMEVTGVSTEYFANTRDPVLSHIPGSALLERWRKLDEKIMIRKGRGHNLIVDYLPALYEFKGFGSSIFEKEMRHGPYNSNSV